MTPFTTEPMMRQQPDRTDRLTLDADFILTMDGPIIHRGRVTIGDGRISAVGTIDELPVVGRHIPLGSSVLMPGFINAHCHLELSAYHGALPASDLWNWLPGLVRLRLQDGASAREQRAIPAAVQSMLESGTTCVGDISRASWLPPTLAGLPIRKVCYIELISGAMSPPSNMAELAQRLAEIPRSDPLLLPGISPHAPYTVTREDLAACVELARHEAVPLAVHLAETPEEVEWLRTGTGRVADWHRRLFEAPPPSPHCGPGEYAVRHGLTPAALIHMNYAEDWRRLCDLPAQRQPAVVYCPRSHRFFRHDAHEFRQMLEAGVQVAIGTDSPASHSRADTQPVSVLDELRWLRREDPDTPPRVLLEMATVHGAAALGLPAKVGRVAPGLEADLVAFDVSHCFQNDPAKAVLDSETRPLFVSVAGHVLIQPEPKRDRS